ncbi:MAG: hypothetical protein JWP11_1540 [Frankiales bacterium]|jgi:hypothetical protein|nr:hypothetical protein [Frankiales bacterium]
MQNRNTLAHFLHDAGLAAWFGGSLMGAIGVNGAAADVDDPRQRARVANAGWGRWTPINLVAIGAHLVGGAQLLKANKGRVAAQKGVLANTNVKLALTAGALGATAYSRLLGQKVMNAGDVPVAGGTASLPSTPPEVAKAQKQLKALQWAIPGLTGAVLASSSLHEEQQRPSEVLRGTLKAVPGRAAALGATAATVVGGAATGAFDKVSDRVKDAV